MSNDPKTKPVINIADPAPETTETTVEEKKVRLPKTRAFISKHKSTLLAGGGLVALVGVSAWAGRASAPSTDDSVTLELESGDVVTGEVVESPDTTVA